MTMTTNELYTPVELAEYLRVSVQTIRRWRLNGEGPKPTVLSYQTVRYRSDDVQAWLDERKRETN